MNLDDISIDDDRKKESEDENVAFKNEKSTSELKINLLDNEQS